MLVRKLAILFFLLFCICSVCFYASAECCDHDFSPAKNNENVVSLSDGFHSFFCIKGCGFYGTDGGVGSKEKCNLQLAYENHATCLSEGKQIFMCTVCYNRTETVTPKLQHSYSKTKKLPTCTEGGYELYTCAFCNGCYKENICPPVEHISDGGIVASLPIYSNKGVIVFSCRICGKELSREYLSMLIRPESLKPPERVQKFKAKSVSSTSVSLVWKKSERADKYKVFFSSDKKSWKSVSASGVNVTVNNLISAKKYYFKIVATNKYGTGEESGIISVCTKPAKAVITDIDSLKKSSATVKWRRLNNVSGYEISYTRKSFDNVKAVRKINVGASGTKTIRGLRSGKKYLFRIRAYKNFGSEKIYGAYSKVRRLKIR